MNHSIDWDRISADFPVNSHLIWLNNCGTTPVSAPVLKSITRWLEEYSRRGSMAEGYSYGGVKESIYRRLESLIKAEPGELVLVHNTAEGMNFLSHGLSLERGEEILLLEKEYPSNVYPWEHWKEKGIRLKTVPMGKSPGEFLQGFRSSLTPQTRIASFSAVHWCTGMPLPLGEIGRICRENGVHFIVDGSQGVGMIDIDVKAQGIGCMAFSGWKWLMGPVGLGVMYIARDKLESIRPIFKGTESVTRDQEYLPYKEALKPTADRFAYSTGNMNDWIYFDASLAYLEGIGFAAAQSRILELSAYLADGLRNSGFEVMSDESGSLTGIVAAAKPGVDATAVVKDLKANHIIAAERLGRIRFSPHIYNTRDQLDKVLAMMSAW